MTGGRIAREVTLVVVSAVFVVPIGLIVLNSFKSHGDIVRDPFGLSGSGLTLANYERAFSDRTFDVAASFMTSAALTVGSVVGVLVFGAALAYVIERRGGRWQLVYLLLLLGLMVPPQVVLIPVVRVLDALGLLFTVPGLVLFYVGSYLPFAAFIYVAALRAVPRSLDEAAAIDGAGPIATFLRVVFPLLTPATVTVAVLVSIFVWNDYVSPQVLLGASRTTTATTGLVRAVGVLSQDWGLVFAFVVLVAAPIVALYLFMQRFIVSGLTRGASR